MSDKTYNLETNSIEKTRSLAESIGRQLKGGEILELVGDVGAGKTAFVSGLTIGLDSTDIVSSPTFTVTNVYSGRLRIAHYDLYRIGSDKISVNELLEQIEDKNTVKVLEWAGSMQDILPEDRIKITIKPSGEYSRKLKISIPESFEYLRITE